MKRDSRRIAHLGINYVVSPAPTMDQRASLELQRALADEGVAFETVACSGAEIRIARDNLHLEILAKAIEGPTLAQFLIVAPDPRRPFDDFVQEAEAVMRAICAVWPASQRQMLKSDVTQRDLYEGTGEHAFGELWEKRLGQPPSSLAPLRRAVLGGGLRLVMPAMGAASSSLLDTAQIEVKIESYLQDTRLLFIETQLAWMLPHAACVAEDFQVRERLSAVNDYACAQVLDFIMEGHHDGPVESE